MKKIIKSLPLNILLLIFVFSAKAQNYNTKSTLPGEKLKTGIQSDHKTQAKKTGVENMIIVYKTHFDIGYSETVQQVIHDYRTSMCDKVLEAIDENSNQPRTNNLSGRFPVGR